MTTPAIRHPMKALSVRQPWAFFIAEGQKPIENRTWSTNHRGPLLIHAAKGMTRDEYEGAIDSLMTWFELDACGRLQDMLPPPDELLRGGIVAVVDLVKVVRSPSTSQYASPWEVPGGYAWHFDWVREVPFVPCKGARGLWDVPPDVVDVIASGGGFDG